MFSDESNMSSTYGIPKTNYNLRVLATIVVFLFVLWAFNIQGEGLLLLLGQFLLCLKILLKYEKCNFLIENTQVYIHLWS